jgi:hypothetical protein
VPAMQVRPQVEAGVLPALSVPAMQVGLQVATKVGAKVGALVGRGEPVPLELPANGVRLVRPPPEAKVVPSTRVGQPGHVARPGRPSRSPLASLMSIPAVAAPRVPPNMSSIEEGASKAAGLPPSMIIPTIRANRAMPIPTKLAGPMSALSGVWVGECAKRRPGLPCVILQLLGGD